MSEESKVCPFCGADNRVEDEWCKQCLTRFEPLLATTQPDEVSDEIPYRTGTRAIALVVVLAMVAAFSVAGLLSALRNAGRLSATAGQTVADERGFKFLDRDPRTGGPVRFNPCEPLHYVVNPDDAPSGGIDDIHEAARLAGETTGIEMVFDGMTDEASGRQRRIYQPDRYGERWAPVFIGWVAHTPGIFDEHDAGVAGTAYVQNSDGILVYVTGAVLLDASENLANGFAPGKTWGKVILHELGHVLGLDHVDNPAQVMHASLVSSPAVWGPGDLAGLRELGSLAGCLETPALP